MPKEIVLLRVIQIVIALNTPILIFGIVMAIKRNIKLHKKIQSFVVLSTLVGVIGLVITIFLGWDYANLTSPTRMTIHRCFSVPLLVLLLSTAWTGLSDHGAKHKFLSYLMCPFWIGTLITGIWFF